MDLVFYGDLFLKSADLDSFDDLDDEETECLVESAREIVSEEEIAESAAQPPMAWLRVPRPLQVIAGAIGRKFGPAAVMLFFGDLRQVRRYLWDPATKVEVDRRAAAALSPDCRVVVGHSLGSVVAYELLRRHSGTTPLLLTLGSPLAMKFIRRRLATMVGASDPLPLTAVKQWVNVFDLRDPVACAGALQTWWPTVDDRNVDNGGDTHDVTRYLGKRKTGQAILEALTRP
jgi:hypothetical protein